MDLLTNLLTSQGGAMFERLRESGFSMDQAEKFVPAAGDQVMAAMAEGATDEGSILSKIDISALASKVGIPSALADQGLKALLPMLTSALGNTGGLGGMMDSVKKLF